MAYIADFLEELSIDDGRQVTRRIIPGKPARYVEPREPLAATVQERLERIGIRRLYSHQARALDLAREGKSIVVTAGTGSGKSLCYNLPVLEELLEKRKSRALYIFPTKALAQDQLRALAELDFPPAATYDGDTPVSARERVRKDASVVITNPDMLHIGILPNHRQWANFLLNLRFVVIDEAHALRGAFGSNVALVLRRLRRLCHHYGSDPRFILTSATIGNPGEHTKALTGLETDVVAIDGAPRGRKFFYLWNPPLIEIEQGRRLSSNAESTTILAALTRSDLRTICFSKTRKSAELVLKYTKELLAKDPDNDGKLAAYRAGYLAEDRREIERALFSGRLLGVSATNALELGIDVGGLDAAICNGFPGTITSVWQQTGRAGRRESDSVAVLVAGEDPLDQYYVSHPEYFFDRGYEEAFVDLNNPSINDRHALCASYELPIGNEDYGFFSREFEQAVDRLINSGELKDTGGKAFLGIPCFPAEQGSIRGTSGAEFLIVEKSGEILGTTDAERAFFEIYPGAIHLHKGETYVVENLDLDARIASVSRAEVDYYTQPKDETNLWIERELVPGIGKSGASFGNVSVEVLVTGFRRVGTHRRETLGFKELDLPPVRFSTEAFWFTTPGAEELGLTPYAFAGGLHAVEHTAISLLPVFAMCDRWDIGGISTPLHQETGLPSIFIYDGYAGGIGIAKRGASVAEELLVATLAHLKSCPCEAGCPSCIQSPKCGNLNEPLDKAAAISILKSLVG